MAVMNLRQHGRDGRAAEAAAVGGQVYAPIMMPREAVGGRGRPWA